ncbi:hypothetical protein B0H16DRAFT_1685609 [Mycena metata]|uniref:Uncharacterized protein n=1 Tax=Mycena metata TaxID=1033252 RepID=A0AAD7NQN0_9AGAR|nr:hypothetical protein B0H16DRAFT_1685609 [Mycena metata]
MPYSQQSHNAAKQKRTAESSQMPPSTCAWPIGSRSKILIRSWQSGFGDPNFPLRTETNFKNKIQQQELPSSTLLHWRTGQILESQLREHQRKCVGTAVEVPVGCRVIGFAYFGGAGGDKTEDRWRTIICSRKFASRARNERKSYSVCLGESSIFGLSEKNPGLLYCREIKFEGEPVGSPPRCSWLQTECKVNCGVWYRGRGAGWTLSGVSKNSEVAAASCGDPARDRSCATEQLKKIAVFEAIFAINPRTLEKKKENPAPDRIATTPRASGNPHRKRDRLQHASWVPSEAGQYLDLDWEVMSRVVYLARRNEEKVGGEDARRPGNLRSFDSEIRVYSLKSDLQKIRRLRTPPEFKDGILGLQDLDQLDYSSEL